TFGAVGTAGQNDDEFSVGHDVVIAGTCADYSIDWQWRCITNDESWLCLDVHAHDLARFEGDRLPFHIEEFSVGRPEWIVAAATGYLIYRAGQRKRLNKYLALTGFT